MPLLVKHVRNHNLENCILCSKLTLIKIWFWLVLDFFEIFFKTAVAVFIPYGTRYFKSDLVLLLYSLYKHRLLCEKLEFYFQNLVIRLNCIDGTSILDCWTSEQMQLCRKYWCCLTKSNERPLRVNAFPGGPLMESNYIVASRDFVYDGQRRLHRILGEKREIKFNVKKVSISVPW